MLPSGVCLSNRGMPIDYIFRRQFDFRAGIGSQIQILPDLRFGVKQMQNLQGRLYFRRLIRPLRLQMISIIISIPIFLYYYNYIFLIINYHIKIYYIYTQYKKWSSVRYFQKRHKVLSLESAYAILHQFS